MKKCSMQKKIESVCKKQEDSRSALIRKYASQYGVGTYVVSELLDMGYSEEELDDALNDFVNSHPTATRRPTLQSMLGFGESHKKNEDVGTPKAKEDLIAAVMKKCSMQKKIESLSKKNESNAGRNFFDKFISERAHDIIEEYNVNEACGGMCDAWNEIGDGVEAVERDDRSGYFSYNDGGWQKTWMTTPFYLAGQGYLDYRSEPEYDRLQDMCEDDYKEHCEKEGIECDLQSDDFYDFENQWWSEGCEIFAYAEIFLYSRDSSEGRYILYGRVSRSFDYTYGRNPKDDLEVSMEFTSSDQLTEENANKFLDAVEEAFANYGFHEGKKEIEVPLASKFNKE